MSVLELIKQSTQNSFISLHIVIQQIYVSILNKKTQHFFLFIRKILTQM